MKLNEKFEATVWGLLCVIGPIVVLVAGATWGLSRATQSDELEAYRRAKEWKVKEAIEAIKTLSEKAAMDSSERTELLELRTQVVTYEKTIGELKAAYDKRVSELTAAHKDETTVLIAKHKEQVTDMMSKHDELTRRLREEVKSLSDHNSELRSALGAIVKDSDSIEVPKGEARFVVPNTLAVGVESAYGTWATVRIGETSESMSPGQQRIILLGTKAYSVTLMKITENSCTFAFSVASASR